MNKFIKPLMLALWLNSVFTPAYADVASDVAAAVAANPNNPAAAQAAVGPQSSLPLSIPPRGSQS